MIYSERAYRSLERITSFVAAKNPMGAIKTVDLIADAIDILKRHPLIGRPAEEGRNELLISRGRTGYAALYRYDELLDIVFVLAIRHQREAGYAE